MARRGRGEDEGGAAGRRGSADPYRQPARGRRTPRTEPHGWPVAALLLLPSALVARWAAFQVPQLTEVWYSQRVYPVAGFLTSFVSGWLPVSLAEVALVVAFVAGGIWTVRSVRRAREARAEGKLLPWLGWRAVGVWRTAGILVWAFLLLWGFNYARPPLAQRLQLQTDSIGSAEVLELGRRAAAAARSLHAELGADTAMPTTLPMGMRELDRAIEYELVRVGLPGDRMTAGLPRGKPLWASLLASKMGISGIYVPFTGEPSINALVPDVALPMTLAHEKAHQRGVTDEGEANLVAFMTLLGSREPYLRYSASLAAASRLLGEAGRTMAEEAQAAFSSMGPGPLRDLQAQRDFWLSHRGAATAVAQRVNDAYLRSNRVPGGVESYGHVVRLLVGLDRAGGVGLDPVVSSNTE